MKEFLKKELGFSERQIAFIQYGAISIFYELSKAFLLGIFYFLTGKFLHFLVVLFILIPLRGNTGGLHFKHYLSCLLFTFLIIQSAMYLSFHILIQGFPQTAALLGICLAVNYRLCPIVSEFRPTPNELVIRKSKRISAIIIFFYILLVYIVPFNTYINTGIWTIILHTIQLILAFLWKGDERHEIS